jgi:hypothetical protein
MFIFASKKNFIYQNAIKKELIKIKTRAIKTEIKTTRFFTSLRLT